jgi:regulatory protein
VRYATTRAKLRHYLVRKLASRGWEGEGEPPVEMIVERCAELGYVDDAGFAVARGAALTRRGFGEQRIAAALRAVGIDAETAAPVRAAAREDALEAALRFARRKRIGPFAEELAAPDQRRRNLAALLRAGHAPDIARRIADAAPGASLDER